MLYLGIRNRRVQIKVLIDCCVEILGATFIEVKEFSSYKIRK
jgi:hypothetical protein